LDCDENVARYLSDGAITGEISVPSRLVSFVLR